MKKILLYSILLLTLSCSNNDEECDDLYDEYIEALSYAGGSQSARDEITRQYNAKKDKLGCD